jgi:hypothetical protein
MKASFSMVSFRAGASWPIKIILLLKGIGRREENMDFSMRKTLQGR